MRRLVVLAAFAAVLAACGSTAATGTPIVFGVTGGNIAPFQVTIEPSGQVSHTGFAKLRRNHLSRATVASLSRLVRQEFAGGLTSRRCPGTNPDFVSGFIRSSGHTITVHGSCEPSFTKLWDTLEGAVVLRGG